jgi:tetratricopeptide (TPR) repeat protein
MASRSGELAMRPLPAVLLDLHEEFATGKLTLTRGRLTKTVDLVNGNPVSTASTPRDETLGHFLVQSGIITETQHRQAVSRAAEMGGKLGEALVSLHVLTFKQLIEQLGKQARHKLVQALRWPQGAWRFEATDHAPEGLQLRMVEVVLEGLRETAVEDLERLARLEGMSFVLTDRGVQLRHELKRVFGETTLDLLGDGATIRELERAFPNRANARLAIDAMLLCDAIAARVAERGLGTPSAAATIPNAPSLDETPASRTVPALYEILFEDVSFALEGAAPIDVVEDGNDSGIVSIEEIEKAADELDHTAEASRTLAAEHQRIQGADHYAVLMIGRRANAKEIETAVSIRTSLLDRDARGLTDPRDRARAQEVRDAYDAARGVLLDDRKRSSYDRELVGGELMQAPPAMDTELAFRVAEESMAKGQWAQAIGQIRTAISRAPGEADYHAALGWAEWMANGCTPEAAEAARPHLNAALEINPDHAAAHDYKGRITAAQRVDDDEALFHLEKATDLDPTRAEAVAAMEKALIARGELRRLERVLKKLLFRLRGRGTTAEAKAWARLARLYLDHLDDAHGADAAAATARRIAPRDSEVQALVQRAENRAYTAEPIRAGWREALGDPHTGAALVKTTEASGHPDAAFLAASTMVALGTADAAMTQIYEARRVRTIVTTARPLGRDHWTLLRHKDDGVELGALMELVASAVHAIAPMTLADSDLDASQRVDDLDLPASFLRLRERAS